jgi:recombinational DNA repair ATPase RecF
MRIRRLELTHFRTFDHAVFEDIPDTVLLVSPNGRGKSSVLEAIAGAKDLVAPYHTDNYEFRESWQQRTVPVWP